MAIILKINRAPVLTLWGVIVAERLGYNHDEALSRNINSPNPRIPGSHRRDHWTWY